jgi:hypothetical protein
MDAHHLIQQFDNANIPIWREGDHVKTFGDVPKKLLEYVSDHKADLLKILPTEPPEQRNIVETEVTPKTSAYAASELEEIALESPAVPLEPQLSELALSGLVGDIVRFLEPTTEAHSAGLLISALCAVGSAIGRGSYTFAGNSKHHANLDAVLVGATGEGRKGTSWDAMRTVLEIAVPEWFKNNIKSGLSSGEGLIWAVRDEIKRSERVPQGKGQAPTFLEVVVDTGIEDKRLLVLEGEFAQPLTVLAREGNTLGVVLRNAWDGGNLSILTKTNAAQATDPHVSVLGHITAEELHAKLTSTDAHNGVGNRILWVYVRRSKFLAFTPKPNQDILEQLANELAKRIKAAQSIGLVEWGDNAARAWEAIYPKLTAARSGLVGSLTARAAPQVIRLAMIYTVLDGENRIQLPHLKAAIALWQYCEASVSFVFKARSGDPVKSRVQQLLGASGDSGMTRTEISVALGNHVRSSDLEMVLTVLEQEKIISRVMVKPVGKSKGGKPAQLFKVVKHAGLAG